MSNDRTLAQTLYLTQDRLRQCQQSEASLRRENQRLHAILAGFSEAAIVLDRDWRLTYLNTLAVHLLQKSPSQLLERPIWQALPEIAESDLHEQLHYAKTQDVCVFCEVFFTVLDSWVEVRISPIEDELLVCLKPIDMRKQLEDRVERRTEQLHQSEQWLHSILNSLQDAVWSMSVDPLALTYMNDAVERVYDRRAAEFFQNPHLWLDVVHPDDRSLVEQSHQLLFQYGYKELDYRIVRPDGEIRWIRDRAYAIRNEAGNIVRIDGIASDISDRKQAEQERDRLFGLSIDMLCVIGFDGYLKQVNPAVEKSLGYSRATLLNTPLIDFVHPDDRERTIAQVERVSTGETLSAFENRYRCRDGSYKWLSWNAIPDVDNHLIYATVRDVTDAKQAAAEQEKFTAIIENSSDFIGICDLSGRTLYVNQSGLNIVGLNDLDEARSFAVYDYHFPEDREFIDSTVFPTLLKTGYWRSEFRFRHFQTGETIPIDYTLFAIDHPDTQQPIYFATVSRDISDRLMTEQQLRQSEGRFRDVSEAAGEYIWEIDSQGIYTFVTERSKDVKGYTPDELIGHTPFEFMPEEDIPNIKAIVENAHKHRQNFTLEHRDILPSGEIVWEQVNGVPLFDKTGDITGFRGAGMSITDRKRAELKLRQKTRDLEKTLHDLQQTQMQLVQSEKLSSLGQLVAGIAHEINNPVSFVYGNSLHASDYVNDVLEVIRAYRDAYPEPVESVAELIDTVELDFLLEDLPQLIRSMQVGANRIQEIVKSLRNFSRSDESEYKTVDIHQGIDSTLMILQNRIKPKADRPQIEIEKQYSDVPMVECYPGPINQVFMNVLANAIDALEDYRKVLSEEVKRERRDRITIATQLIPDRQTVEIRIRDNGPGIPDDIRQQIFNPFFTTKPVGKGTGLGMSISYQIIVEKHGGTIACTSFPEGGTEFAIELPISHVSHST